MSAGRLSAQECWVAVEPSWKPAQLALSSLCLVDLLSRVKWLKVDTEVVAILRNFPPKDAACNLNLKIPVT